MNKLIFLSLFLFLGFFSGCDVESIENNNYSKKKSKIIQNEIEVQKGSDFTILELLDLMKKNASQIEDHILSKGYHFLNSSGTDSSMKMIYKYHKVGIMEGYIYYLQCIIPKPNNNFKTSLSWTFVDEHKNYGLDTTYLNIKKEASQLGFKLNKFGAYKIPNNENNNSIGTNNFSLKKGKTIIDFNISKIGPENLPFFNIILQELPN